jgi:hypothetical protein
VTTILRTLVTGRRGIIVAAVAAVIAVIAISNRCGAPATPQTIPAGPASPTPQPSGSIRWSPTPTPPRPPSPAATSPAATDNDGDPGTNPFIRATITAGPADPRDAAVAFVAALLNTLAKTPEQWRAGFADKVTPQLRDLYATVDPSAVPSVGRIDSPVTATVIGDAVVTVRLPVTNGGTITVTMLGATHRWLVSQVDYTGPTR